MADQYAVLVEGIDDLKNFSGLKDQIRLAALRALNRTTDQTRTKAARDIAAQVNFGPQYLSPSKGNLVVSQRANRSTLQTKIKARGRATSLSRFVTSDLGNGNGVRLQVAPGKTRFMRRAFLIKLPQGKAAITENKFNRGLAIRLGPGEKLENKKTAISLGRGLYLLYGPSVDQVFLNAKGKGVAADLEDYIRREIETEFFRLLEI